MIGPTYLTRAAQAVLGPSRSPLFPAVLWTGWLDSAGDLIAMTGLSVPQTAFGPSGGGVTNTVPIDCGVAGAGWTIHALGLFDSATGDLVVSADLPAPLSPDSGDALMFDVGGLTFAVTA